MTVFDYLDSRAYLVDDVERNGKVTGYKTKLAAAAGCQKSYLSQVLRGHWNLTQEHGLGLCQFWNFSELETDYFLELVSYTKVSLPGLKQRIKKKLQTIKSSHQDLGSRFQENKVAERNQKIYYSSWHFGALHILSSIPAYQTVEAMSSRLSLPPAFIKDCLLELKRMGLVKDVQGRWEIQHGHIHLSRTSELNSFNHSNWRQRAVLDSQSKDTDGLHYTVVQSQSVEDFQKIKDLLLKTIDQTRKVVASSREEEAVGFCLDFFRV